MMTLITKRFAIRYYTWYQGHISQCRSTYVISALHVVVLIMTPSAPCTAQHILNQELGCTDQSDKYPMCMCIFRVRALIKLTSFGSYSEYPK